MARLFAKRYLSLSHVDSSNLPCMVDISSKILSIREAHARCFVTFPQVVFETLRNTNGDIITRKGPVITTAIIAGVLAAKKTHELIPFCHQVPLDDCKIEIAEDNMQPFSLRIDVMVRTHYNTGVEMEALVGASNAALVVYDMCKALSHDIKINDLKLMSKSGGKRLFARDDNN